MQRETTEQAHPLRVPSFDLWRIVGVGLVIFVHLLQRYRLPLGNAFGVPGFYFVTLGGIGVTLLLILSGAVLEYNYGAGRRRPYGTFIWRRLVHLYPTYWISVLFAVALFGRRLPEPMSLLETVLDWAGLLAAFGETWSHLILPTSWFLAILIPLYLMFPLLSRAVERRPATTLLVVLFITVVARLYSGHEFPGGRGFDWFPPARLFEFTLGMWMVRSPRILAAMRRPLADLSGLPARVLTYLAAISFPAYLIHWAVQRWGTLAGLRWPVFIPLFLLVTALAAAAIYEISRRIERRLRRLGAGHTPKDRSRRNPASAA